MMVHSRSERPGARSGRPRPAPSLRLPRDSSREPPAACHRDCDSGSPGPTESRSRVPCRVSGGLRVAGPGAGRVRAVAAAGHYLRAGGHGYGHGPMASTVTGNSVELTRTRTVTRPGWPESLACGRGGSHGTVLLLVRYQVTVSESTVPVVGPRRRRAPSPAGRPVPRSLAAHCFQGTVTLCNGGSSRGCQTQRDDGRRPGRTRAALITARRRNVGV
jgi:hypothetical protein